jgi:hypothetical protein
MKEAVSKMRVAVAYTILLKSKEGQEHGLYCEDLHRKEFSKYADATALIYAVYNAIKFEKSSAALLAFANEAAFWALNMESRLWEIKGIDDQFHYFKEGDVAEVYNSINFMNEDILQVLLPDVIKQVHTILIDSQNKAP